MVCQHFDCIAKPPLTMVRSLCPIKLCAFPASQYQATIDSRCSPCMPSSLNAIASCALQSRAHGRAVAWNSGARNEARFAITCAIKGMCECTATLTTTVLNLGAYPQDAAAKELNQASMEPGLPTYQEAAAGIRGTRRCLSTIRLLRTPCLPVGCSKVAQ